MKLKSIEATVRDANSGASYKISVVLFDEHGYRIEPPRILLWRDGAAYTAHDISVSYLT